MHSPWLDVYCQVDRKIYKLDSYWISLQPVRRKLCLVENIDSNLRLITSGDRNAAGIFTIPDKPEDIIDNIEEKGESWCRWVPVKPKGDSIVELVQAL